jgi:uncharacterized membrane protein
MKLDFAHHKLHMAVLILCFLYAGASLVFFITNYSNFVRAENMESRMRDVNQTPDFSNMSGIFPPPPRPEFREDRMARVARNTMITSLIGCIVSILAGISILDLVRKKEKRELTKSIIESMTTPEEKKVISALEDAGGELTQAQIVDNVRLTKVKAHRIIKHLEQMKIITKYPYGVTNKIVLEKISEKNGK